MLYVTHMHTPGWSESNTEIRHTLSIDAEVPPLTLMVSFPPLAQCRTGTSGGKMHHKISEEALVYIVVDRVI